MLQHWPYTILIKATIESGHKEKYGPVFEFTSQLIVPSYEAATELIQFLVPYLPPTIQFTIMDDDNTILYQQIGMDDLIKDQSIYKMRQELEQTQRHIENLKSMDTNMSRSIQNNRQTITRLKNSIQMARQDNIPSWPEYRGLRIEDLLQIVLGVTPGDGRQAEKELTRRIRQAPYKQRIKGPVGLVYLDDEGLLELDALSPEEQFEGQFITYRVEG